MFQARQALRKASETFSGATESPAKTWSVGFDVGGGPRFQLSRKYPVNLRTDFARGKDIWTWSMGVGEAF
jgi:hypothetical protein